MAGILGRDIKLHWADRWKWPPSPVADEKPPKGPVILEAEEIPVDVLPSAAEPRPPWLTARCGVCEREVHFYMNVDYRDYNPFNSIVLVAQCDQCASRLAAVIPPVHVVEADTLTLRNVDLVHDGNTHEDL